MFQKIRIFVIAISALFYSCSVNKSVKDGAHAYKLKQYSVAIDLLVKEFGETNRKAKKAEKAFLIADSYQKLNDYTNAVDWLESSLELYDRPETLHELAFAFKKTEQYGKAANAFAMLYEETEDKAKYKRELEICQKISKWSEKDNPYTFNINPSFLNSDFSDYSISLYKDDQIVFVSDRESDFSSDTYKWTGNAFSDLYISDKNGRYIKTFDTPVNSEFNEGPPTFSKDFDQIYFTRCSSSQLRDSHCRLYYAYYDDDVWSEPFPLNFFPENINYGNPTLIEEDSILVFSANLNGHHDLYYSVLEDGAWSEAILMPDYMNSDGNEMFPTSDGDTLYYSSDGLAGLGGLDIFKTYIQANGKFSRPENLRLPINSGFDDFSYVVDDRDNISFGGYFSSNRGVQGGDDIYRFNAYKTTEEESEDPVEEPEDPANISLQEIYLAVKVIGKSKTNDIQLPLQGANLEMAFDLATEDHITDKNARVIISVNEDDIFTIKANYPEFYTNSIIINVKNEIPTDINKKSYTINKTIILDPIIIGEEIILEDIFYDFDKDNIRSDATPSLDKLAKLLEDNPTINIQLASHTDCRGEVDYNADLSQRRAQSAVDYILSQGISPQRITAKGFGESKFAIDCNCDDCTEDEHQANRRTTFTVLQ